MKRVKNMFVLVVLMLGFSMAKAQDGVAKVYLIRSNNYVGSLVNNTVFMDGKPLCKLKNKHYSVHEATLGEHAFRLKGGGLEAKKISQTLKVTLKPDAPVYLSLSNTSPPHLEQLTSEYGAEAIKTLTETKDCGIKKK